MTDKVLCPWCGAEMVIVIDKNRPTYWEGYMRCAGCDAHSPFIWTRSEKDLRPKVQAAALRRYVPPCRPLTWEEVTQHDGSTCVWVEDRLMVGNSGFYDTNEWIGVFGKSHGKTWRCWPRKPTEAEREAAGWEDAE